MYYLKKLIASLTVTAAATASEECTTMVALAQPGMELAASKFGEGFGKFFLVGTMQYVVAQSQAVIAALSAKAVAAKAMAVAIYASPLTPYIVGGTVVTYTVGVGTVYTYYYFNPSTNALVETTKQHMEEAAAELKLRKIQITREQVETLAKTQAEQAKIKANVIKSGLNTQLSENKTQLTAKQAALIEAQAKLKILQTAQAVSPQQVMVEARKLAPAMAKL